MGYCQNARSLPSCGLNWQFLRSLCDMNKMKYITAVLILIQRNNQQNLQQVPACVISDQDWVSHAEIWDRLHLLISNKLSFNLSQGLSDLALTESRTGSQETRMPLFMQPQTSCLWNPVGWQNHRKKKTQEMLSDWLWLWQTSNCLESSLPKEETIEKNLKAFQ